METAVPDSFVPENSRNSRAWQLYGRRVLLGAGKLTMYYENVTWRDLIDVPSLDMSEPSLCIGGQLCGSYETLQHKLGLDEQDMINYGFEVCNPYCKRHEDNASNSLQGNENGYDLLLESWLIYLAAVAS